MRRARLLFGTCPAGTRGRLRADRLDRPLVRDGKTLCQDVVDGKRIGLERAGTVFLRLMLRVSLFERRRFHRRLNDSSCWTGAKRRSGLFFANHALDEPAIVFGTGDSPSYSKMLCRWLGASASRVERRTGSISFSRK